MKGDKNKTRAQRLVDREAHPEVYCVRERKDGTPCTGVRQKGLKYCSFHARQQGEGGHPITAASTALAQRILTAPPELMEDFERSLLHPDQTSLAEYIAIIDAEANRLLKAPHTASGLGPWKAARKLLDEAREAAHAGNGPALAEAMDALVALVDSQDEVRLARAEFDRKAEQRRKMADSEARQRVAKENVMTFSDARALVHLLILAVERNVSSFQEKRATIREALHLMPAVMSMEALPAEGGEGEKG